MRKDKKERIKALYELERLILKKKRTQDEKQRVIQLRKLVDPQSEVKSSEERFDVERYKELKAKGLKDREIAKLMDMHHQSLYVAKVRNGLKPDSKAKGPVNFRHLKPGKYNLIYDKRMKEAGYSEKEIAEKLEIPLSEYKEYTQKLNDPVYIENLKKVASNNGYDPKIDIELGILGFTNDQCSSIFGMTLTSYARKRRENGVKKNNLQKQGA